MKQTSFIFFVLLFFNVHAQRSPVQLTGDILQIGLPVVALASTCYYPSDDKPDWQFVKSFATAMLITHGLKHIINKERPDGGNYSFPSGHTTSAFSAATFLHIRYGWKVGVPALALASFVGYSRIYARRHDVWDVMAGAGVGIGSALLFTKPFHSKKLNVYINKSESYYLVGLNYRF